METKLEKEIHEKLSSLGVIIDNDLSEKLALACEPLNDMWRLAEGTSIHTIPIMNILVDWDLSINIDNRRWELKANRYCPELQIESDNFNYIKPVLDFACENCRKLRDRIEYDNNLQWMRMISDLLGEDWKQIPFEYFEYWKDWENECRCLSFVKFQHKKYNWKFWLIFPFQSWTIEPGDFGYRRWPHWRLHIPSVSIASWEFHIIKDFIAFAEQNFIGAKNGS